jgi:hypothetical protein
MIDYPKGNSVIQIQGTNIVPEFGPTFVSLVVAAAFVGVVGFSIVVKHRIQTF